MNTTNLAAHRFACRFKAAITKLRIDAEKRATSAQRDAKHIQLAMRKIRENYPLPPSAPKLTLVK